MKNDKKNIAIGAFLTICAKLDTNVRGGKQKLQKIIGKDIFYQSENKKLWLYNTNSIRNMTITKLEKLTELIKKYT